MFNPSRYAFEQLKKSNQKIEKFEIFSAQQKKLKIDSKDLKVDSLTEAQDVSLSIRVIQDQKLGFSFTTSLEKSAIDQAIQTAIEIARYMPKDPYHELQTFSNYQYPELQQKDVLDHSGLEVSTREKIEMAKSLEDQCRKFDPRIKGVRSASFHQSYSEVQMMDSQGTELSHQSSLFSTNVYCKAEQEGESQMGYDFDFSHNLSSLDLSLVATRGATHALELLKSTAPPTMTCPAVLRNDVVSELVDFLSSSFSAEQVDKGKSMLQGKQGVKLFSPEVTLIDDGMKEGGYQRATFDAEGVPTRQATLVKNGVIESYLYNSYYAKKSGQSLCGNAQRGLMSPPSIGISNLYLKEGKKSFKSLIADIDRGILLTDLMGVHMANPISGDFSLGASGMLIEKGELTRPVKGFAVAGNVLDVFRQIADIGNDMRFFGSIGCPSVRVEKISVSGK